MAKFIKFTNVTILDFWGRIESTMDEIICSTDQIASMSEIGDNHYFGVKSVAFKKDGDRIKSFAPFVQNALISKEDYENAKKILLEV